ncbi:MAG: response regulator transcription factor, partial [Micromonosporaceae bacterium]|nr:response regulator transcription factor [Micromonosporaceae bacterium]
MVSAPPPTSAIRVVVADDQTAVREGLALLLDLLDDVTVVGLAGDGEDAVRLVAEHDPDVVLMDLRMPRLSGIAATGQIRDRYPRTQVVVLTTYAEDADILAALRAGALGYLTKDAGRTQIAHAVRAAAAGQSVLDPQVQQRLLAA